MRRIILWEPSGTAPLRLALDDAIASALIRAGVAAPENPADGGLLTSGAAVSAAFPVEVAVQHGIEPEIANIVVPLAVANMIVAADLGAILPARLLDLPTAFRSRDGGDFIISPVDGQQLTGVN